MVSSVALVKLARIWLHAYMRSEFRNDALLSGIFAVRKGIHVVQWHLEAALPVAE